MCQDVSGYVMMFQDVSGCVRMCQDVSTFRQGKHGNEGKREKEVMKISLNVLTSTAKKVGKK